MQHLTREQCTRLKEAGYPQDKAEFYWLPDNEDPWFNGATWIDRLNAPTLCEMIEWLGYRATSIGMDDKHRFYADGFKGGEQMGKHFANAKLASGYGPRPIDAVCELCIEVLKEKP